MKKVSELFAPAVLEGSSINDLTVLEVKFSKKANAAIIHLEVDKKIEPKDVLLFENNATKIFSLKSFKVVPILKEKLDVLEEDITKILDYLKVARPYVENVLEISKLEYAKEANKVNIELKVPNSNFLKLQKTEEFLNEAINSYYGTNIEFEFSDSTTAKSDFVANHKEEKVIAPPPTLEKPKEQKSQDEYKVQAAPQTQSSQPTYFKPKEEKQEGPKAENVIMGKDITSAKVDKIEDINQDMENACIEGKIEACEVKTTKTGKEMFSLEVSDETSTIAVKIFADPKRIDIGELSGRLKVGKYIKADGKPQYDMFAKDISIILRNIVDGKKPPERKDEAEVKRVELHLHTQMSSMDGVSSATDLVKQAIKWGHKAIAITDHGVAQSFPEANLAAFNYAEKKFDIKVLYGTEGYLVPDVAPVFEAPTTYTVFDIETTGFTPGSDAITEIAAVKVKDGVAIDEFSTFVNPERSIPKEVQELTHITPDMVKEAPKIEEALRGFLDFAKDTVIVAHNAKFDTSFINYYADKCGYEKPEFAIDTLAIAREMFEGYENHKLGTIAANLNIELENAHRAINDARATAKVFIKMCEVLESRGMKLNEYVQTEYIEDKRNFTPYHIIIFAKNYVGLKNLYKLISFAHIRYFHKKPRLSRSLINRYREGLIIGSACERGELYQAVLENRMDEAREIAKYYDYLEVQPIGNNAFYIRNGTVKDEVELQEINKKIINLGKELNIPVVATGDVHFMNPQDELYRRIIMAGQGYDDADEQAPLYLRTTNEMLKEFDYLDEATAREIVIENTNKIADMFEEIKPVVDGTYNPVIDGSDEEIERLTYEKARSIYGDPLPEIVEARIKKELNSIITNGFSVMYIIAQKLVKKSNDDGYLVGSRGSVGSSFVATMSGITEVNPLPPHYVCPHCKYSEFPPVTVTTGVDMEDKDCPKCGNRMKKDGMDIPFETFLGFKGDKVPDIDLNFSGDYQAKAHAYTEVLFGKYKTFRAGTISTLAEKTAYGFVKKYYEGKNQYVRVPEINRVSRMCTGIKRTTGQHPGGIIVVPRDKEIYDFCPVQRPADDPTSSTITTHFDFHSIHDNLLKLDILGHDDPTVIRMLEDLTGIDAKTIPLDEPKVMSLFSSTEALGITEEQERSKVATYAIPEFGTKFVRQMLLDTKPTTFGELVRISGLSHGTDVWLNNAQSLIEQGITTLKEAICTRDDIMIYLIQKGLDPSLAFKIMEITRKGKAKKDLTEEMKEKMRECDVPEWYIDSCLKIKYMFPKAHACAYVMMAYRIAYFKVYYPKAFYATYLTVRADAFNADVMCTNKQKVKEAMKTIESNPEASNVEKDMVTVLEVVNEMMERGIDFLPIDLYKSDATKFLVEEDGIRPPLSAIPTFGTVNAKNIAEARNDGKFSSKENLVSRAKIGKSALELLDKYGCTKGMPNSSQVSLFDEF
ncbi:MAG: PolC-type DNA polymerase III [Clostridia bacterium]|nr:PolC-type DNA polymerase III [Clostridia bacterium]